MEESRLCKRKSGKLQHFQKRFEERNKLIKFEIFKSKISRRKVGAQLIEILEN